MRCNFNNNKLLLKLGACGVSVYPVSLIDGFLAKRTQNVVDGQKSVAIPVTSGMDQGSFTILFLNDWPDNLKKQFDYFYMIMLFA